MAQRQRGEHDAGPGEVQSQYWLLLVAVSALLIGNVAFRILPSTISTEAFRVPVLSALAAFVIAALGNIVVGWIQRGATRASARALSSTIDDLRDSVHTCRQTRVFAEVGLIGVFPNRSSAMQAFLREIEREDEAIDFVGTSLLGALDPAGENVMKRRLVALLLQKRQNGVKIRALLMHPAYGEFRERVENRERAAVAKDIQATLRYLIQPPPNEHSGQHEAAPGHESGGEATQPVSGGTAQPPPLLDRSQVRLYAGVNTAFTIFTSRSMLVNVSTLHGPTYDNFTVVIEDTDNPSSIFKVFRANQFAQPWQSEKTIRLDLSTPGLLETLLATDFTHDEYRFREGNWPATIPGTPTSAAPTP